jgi:hypothetical protein
MFLDLLVVLVGQIFVPITQGNLLFVRKCVFVGYSPLHKGVKFVDVSTGRVYISCDVVFYENVLPIEALHPNADALLKKEILLLPSSSSHEGAHNIDDHMSIIVPITNVSQEADATEKKNLS